ncbi:putative thiol peroxidase [compost metagenome]
MVTLSDYKDNSFGKAYGVFIKEFALDHRAVFVLDKDNTIRYIEVLKEMSEHPNYDAPIDAVKQLLS